MVKKKWEILYKNGSKKVLDVEQIIEVLLKNRKIKNPKEFFTPVHPDKIKLESIGVEQKEITKAAKRLKTAFKNKEHIVVYGDYDADGVCATAIVWENLYKEKFKVLPYIPERFSEGYGINPESVEKLKEKDKDLKVIITVDNGIVAYKGISKAKELGIDVIVIDHHQKEKLLKDVYAVIHSDKVCGSALSWLFMKRFFEKTLINGFELAGIGTISDQMPLIEFNRSFARFGVEALNKSKRMGLRAIMREARIEKVGVYEIGFIIAPRINAAGRLTHAIDSLRLICTRNFYKANELALFLGRVNQRRQKIVDEVLTSALKNAEKSKDKIIVIASKKYHEGVIGLAAGKITEKLYRPSIVLSINGENAKASARSISGFNIIKAIKKLKDLIIEGGGHPMAAGFSIKKENIEKFKKEINKIANKELTKDVLTKSMKVDMEIEFDQINQELVNEIKNLAPFGLGNPQPLFLSKKVKVLESKKVGSKGNHLKLKLQKSDVVFDSIFFNTSSNLNLKDSSIINLVYSVEENYFNGNRSLQLKVKDLVF